MQVAIAARIDGVAMQLHVPRLESFMSRFKVFMPAALVLGGILVCTTASMGKQEYTAKTKKACTFCHAKMEPGTKDGKPVPVIATVEVIFRLL